jgi:hypothetical protein
MRASKNPASEGSGPEGPSRGAEGGAKDTVEPGSPTAERIQLLRNWTAPEPVQERL